MAAMRNRPEIWNIPFYMMHLSGGTQDVLSVTWEAENMHFKNVMTSMDITAGQLIDRVGVALGPVSYTHLDVYKRQMVTC